MDEKMFLGYHHRDCKEEWNTDHNLDVVCDILDLYMLFKRRTLLAIASVGIDFMCVSLLFKCCVDMQYLYDGEAYEIIEHLPHTIRVKDIFKDLYELCSKMMTAAKRKCPKDEDSCILFECFDIGHDNTYSRWAFGLFELLSSTSRGDGYGAKSMGSKIFAHTWQQFTDENGSEVQPNIPLYDLCNCVSRSLFTATTVDMFLDMNIPFSSECGTESTVRKRKELGLDKYAHVQAWHSNKPEDFTTYDHDMAYYLLIPLETRIDMLTTLFEAPEFESCREMYIRNMRLLQHRIRTIIQSYGERTSRGEIPPQVQRPRHSKQAATKARLTRMQQRSQRFHLKPQKM
uniref:Uncharacterized protein n=1 Tax=viral metagenome TaxID=1070528 RepID=A0A6C0C077_9ZZZZ